MIQGRLKQNKTHSALILIQVIMLKHLELHYVEYVTIFEVLVLC